jgi:hypothetical protein
MPEPLPQRTVAGAGAGPGVVVPQYSQTVGSVGSTDSRPAETWPPARVRVALEQGENPISAYDLLVAGQALRRGLTVVTANTTEFGRVTGLSWQDWSD